MKCASDKEASVLSLAVAVSTISKETLNKPVSETSYGGFVMILLGFS